MIFVYDTETTGIWVRGVPDNDAEQPHLVQYAGALCTDDGRVLKAKVALVNPCQREIPAGATAIHGITTEMARNLGEDLTSVLLWHLETIKHATVLVGHNVIGYDEKVMRVAFWRRGVMLDEMPNIQVFDTMLEGVPLCKLPGKYGDYKWPRLEELHHHLFQEGFQAHNALADLMATARCYLAMTKDQTIGVDVANKVDMSVEDVINAK